MVGHFKTHKPMKEFEDIVLTAYIVLIGILSAILISRYWYFRRTRKARTNLFSEPKFIVFCRVVTILATPIFILGIVNYIFILQKGNLFAPYWGKVLVVSLLTLLCISELIYNFYPLPTKTNRILNIIFIIPLSALSFLFTQSYLKAIEHPAESSSVIIELPFEGTWIASGAGASGLTNHHDRIKSQKYAIDIVKFGDNNRLFENEGVKNEDSYTFEAKVISPVNGKIVFALDTLPDVKNTDRDKLAGNHIIIQFQDSLFVALAHLKQNSIQVKQGDIVGIGHELALVGNSGNTDFPHLHIHIQDTETYGIETSKTYPIRFRAFKRMRYLFWARQTNNFLLSNDIVKPK